MVRLSLFVAVLIAASAAIGCGTRAAEPTTADPMTIVQIAAADSRFTTLVGAVTAAGLVDTLNGPGPFTVFAPTNDAFARLPEGTVAGLTNEQLTKVLTYHVLSGAVPAATALTLNGQQVPTVNGAPITITVTDGAVMINQARVIITDIQASNGIIHVIDQVILPPM